MLIEMLLLANYGLCRCRTVTVMLLLVNYRLHDCSLLIEKLLL